MAATAARRWTPRELSLLETRKAQKVAPKLIAEELGRSIGSVVMRCQIGNVRKCQKRLREQNDTRVLVEPAEFPPPPYVLREREIRLSISPTSLTQIQFLDPVEGYSALDSKIRKISVQDALEICALYNGKPGEIVALASAYGITKQVVEKILNGTFFNQLIKGGRK